MTSSPDLFSYTPPTPKPDFDGATYDRKRDHARLSAQFTRVFDLMKDATWRTLSEIQLATGAPAASISARLRDIRKSEFGGHTVERKYVSQGLWAYRVILNNSQEAA